MPIEMVLHDANAFWSVARYLIATYGAFKAMMIVRFNMDAMSAMAYNRQLNTNTLGRVFRWGHPGRILDLIFKDAATNWDTDNRPTFEGQRIPFPGAFFNNEDMRPLLQVLIAAVLWERLGMRRNFLRRYPDLRRHGRDALQFLGWAQLLGQPWVRRHVPWRHMTRFFLE